jgi:hypothetical protein
MNRRKGGDILPENVIFIVLNVMFITILVIFVFIKTGDAATLEEIYAKQIAMIIDSSKPSMVIHLNMEKAVEKAKKELGEGSQEQIVQINDNIVTVKLRKKGGYSYSFFNDVDISCYPDLTGKEYVFVINPKGSGSFCPAGGGAEYG